MFGADEFITDSLPSMNDNNNQAGADAQLFSTLCEIDKMNYLYMFERCKAHNINARQLRYLEKDHIRRIIPLDQVGILAEFEYMHNEWKKQFNLKVPQLSLMDTPTATSSTTEISATTITASTSTPKILHGSCKTMNNDQASTEKPTVLEKSYKRKFGKGKTRGKTIESSGGNLRYEFPLDEIIPNDMRYIREEYKINGILTDRERRRLAGSLVEYFQENDIHMSRNVMEDLAEQISTAFPTESKLAWHDSENKQRRGRLCLRLYNTQRNKRRIYSRGNHFDEINSSKEVDMDEVTQDEVPQEDGNETEAEAERIKLWLQNNKCEDNDELVQLWYETTNYRTRQLKKYNLTTDCEHLDEIFENWPAYTQPIGNALISIDFNVLYPNSENTFSERFPIFLQKIHKLYMLEIRSDLYDQYQKNVHSLNTESKHYILFYLLHSLVKPTRAIHPKQMARRYSIPESLNAFSKLIKNPCEMDDYNESRPFIYIQGAIFNVEKVYVAFKHSRYEMTFKEALLTSMQIHQTFKIDFPLACYNFWILMQAYFFNITPEPDVNMSIVDHIINFLNA